MALLSYGASLQNITAQSLMLLHVLFSACTFRLFFTRYQFSMNFQFSTAVEWAACVGYALRLCTVNMTASVWIFIFVCVHDYQYVCVFVCVCVSDALPRKPSYPFACAGNCQSMFVQKYLLLLFSTLLGRCLRVYSQCVCVCLSVYVEEYGCMCFVFIFNKSVQARRDARLQWIKLLKNARERKQQQNVNDIRHRRCSWAARRYFNLINI